MERGRTRSKIRFHFVFVVTCILFTSAIFIGFSVGDELPYDDIKQDSNGNYHRVFIDNSTGNYEIYYTNDIGGDFPEDWNPSVILYSSQSEVSILEFKIYISMDMIFIKWSENGVEYYVSSEDYGSNWKGPYQYLRNEMISLKYAIFDPLRGEPYIPDHLRIQDAVDNYEYYLVQHSTTSQIIHDDIKALGGIFCGYTPYHSYVIWMNDTIKQEVEQLSYVRWIGYYHPAYKIMPGLLEEDGLFELNVEVFEETDGETNLEKVIQDIESLGGLILYNGTDNYIIQTRILADKIDDIVNMPEVEWIDGVGELWPRPPIQLHHISMIYDGSDMFNISETQNFTAVGWEDANETDLNRAWEPVWHVEGNIGEVIGDKFTVTFKATKPGTGALICMDELTGINISLEIQVIGEVKETQEEVSPRVYISSAIVLIAIIGLAVIIYRKMKKSRNNKIP